MALTENVKHARINVSTGETDHTYYDDIEWAAIVAARLANRLPKAKARATRRIKRAAQARVDAIIKPPALIQAQVRAMELLEIRIESGVAWSVEEAAERAALGAILASTRAWRARETFALEAIDNAVTINEVRAVEL